MKNSYGSVTFCAVLCGLGGGVLVILAIIAFVNGLIGAGCGYLAGALVSFVETVAISCVNSNAGNVVINNEDIKKLKAENKLLVEKIEKLENELHKETL